MRKQNIERSNKWSVCGEKVSEFIVMFFLVLFAISTLVFNPVKQFILYASDYYNNFNSNKTVGAILDFILTDGSLLTVNTKGSINDGTILTKKGNDQLFESGFAVNYVRDELPAKLEISNEDTDAKLVTTQEFEKFLQNYATMSFSQLVNSYYIVDPSTAVTEKIIDVNKFLEKDCTLGKGEKIFIYHTHGSEGYADSDGSKDESVIGVGTYLAELLEAKGYEVIHDTNYYDRENGVVNRNVAYSQGLVGVTKALEENPDIGVIIDLHRDSGAARTTTVDGKEMCKVMLFNGLCYDSNGEIEYISNPNREYNLSFSFQLKLMADYMYEGFMHKIYLKDYRYNMHVAKNYILAEVGTQENTVEQAMNSMEIFAEVLDAVLQGGD